jgi:hypothetical protein
LSKATDDDLAVDAAVRRALESDRTIDTRTTGRRSGRPRRIEIWFHAVDGRVYISGLPGCRDWHANLLAQPEFMFHLKQSVLADVPARARPVTDSAERRRVPREILERMGRIHELEDWIDHSPIVDVELDFDRTAPGTGQSKIRRARRSPSGLEPASP